MFYPFCGIILSSFYSMTTLNLFMVNVLCLYMLYDVVSEIKKNNNKRTTKFGIIVNTVQHNSI